MRNQIECVSKRDGYSAAVEYARRALSAYRSAARYRNPEKPKLRHFVHAMPYRPHVVHGIVEIRAFLRSTEPRVK